MKILRLLGFTILILGFLLGSSALAGDFKAADIAGEYAYSFKGSITITDPTTLQTQTIPTVTVGQLVSSQPGEFTVTAVMNIGGFAILNLTSPSLEPTTFTVDATTGIGTASAPVTATAPPVLPLGAYPLGFSESDFTGTVVWGFSFVIDANGVLDIIGTSLAKQDSSGLTPIGAFTGLGTAKPQESVPAE